MLDMLTCLFMRSRYIRVEINYITCNGKENKSTNKFWYKLFISF